MESKSPVEAGPPVLIENVVRLLLPPPAREHVLGDLAERYSTPASYVGEALRTVPFVIVSQIRRTSQFALWPLVMLVLCAGFATGGKVTWVHTIIPAAATMIGFMLRDAYKVRDLQHLWRQGAIDAFVAAAFAGASQAILAPVRPDLLLGPSGVAGGAAAIGMLYLLRIQNPGRTQVGAPAPDVETMTLAQLREEAASYVTLLRRGTRIELAASFMLIPLFTTFAIVGRPSIARIGAAITVVGGAYVMWRMWRSLKALTPIAADADFASTASIYRARLQRHQAALRTIWLWYLLPLTLGPALVFVAAAQRAARPELAAVGTALALVAGWTSIIWPARRHANRMQARISALQRAEDQR